MIRYAAPAPLLLLALLGSAHADPGAPARPAALPLGGGSYALAGRAAGCRTRVRLIVRARADRAFEVMRERTCLQSGVTARDVGVGVAQASALRVRFAREGGLVGGLGVRAAERFALYRRRGALVVGVVRERPCCGGPEGWTEEVGRLPEDDGAAAAELNADGARGRGPDEAGGVYGVSPDARRAPSFGVSPDAGRAPDRPRPPTLEDAQLGVEPPADADLRARIVAIADANAGLGYADPATRARYVELLFPHDISPLREAYARSMSSCGLFAMAVLREAGVEHACLSTPYSRQIGQAVANVVRIGRAHDAWTATITAAQTRAAADPLPGDVLIVGHEDPAWGGPTHVLVVTAVERVAGPDGTAHTLLTSVDGGQPHIARRRRLLEVRGGARWLRAIEAPYSLERPSGGRRVQGWLDAGRLAR